MATVRLASDGEICLAMSRPVDPFGYSRCAPSGKVSATTASLLLLTRCLRLQVSVAGLSWVGAGPGGACAAVPRGEARLYDVRRARNAPACRQTSAKVSDARRRNLGDAVGAAPAAIAPRQIPARAIGQRCRHDVEPAGAKRVTAAEPRECHPAAGPQTEPADRLLGIVRAGRQMPAVEPGQRGEAVAIDLDHSPREEAGAARKIVDNHAHTALLAHAGSTIPIFVPP